ncbi:hypothetical protein F1Z71_001911 [Escherichia coli]|nr:hypothetical protein [Escherichia coli]EJD4214351.1 hypothetical protein [Escherichia coli]EKV5484741.1 hypothetical protein [Escherichia coli]HBB7044595.1 hypothetical protein [Escherichia coli]
MLGVGAVAQKAGDDNHHCQTVFEAGDSWMFSVGPAMNQRRNIHLSDYDLRQRRCDGL